MATFHHAAAKPHRCFEPSCWAGWVAVALMVLAWAIAAWAWFGNGGPTNGEPSSSTALGVAGDTLIVGYLTAGYAIIRLRDRAWVTLGSLSGALFCGSPPFIVIGGVVVLAVVMTLIQHRLLLRRKVEAPSPAYRFDPMTGESLAPAEPRPSSYRFDPMTGRPLVTADPVWRGRRFAPSSRVGWAAFWLASGGFLLALPDQFTGSPTGVNPTSGLHMRVGVTVMLAGAALALAALLRRRDRAWLTLGSAAAIVALATPLVAATAAILLALGMDRLYRLLASGQLAAGSSWAIRASRLGKGGIVAISAIGQFLGVTITVACLGLSGWSGFAIVLGCFAVAWTIAWWNTRAHPFLLLVASWAWILVLAWIFTFLD